MEVSCQVGNLMTEFTKEPEAPKGAMAFMERYGWTFVVVTLTIFVIEMTVFTSLLAWGVDLAPMALWIQSTTGLDASGFLETSGYIAAAYVLTRFIKPFSLALSFALTPALEGWVNGPSNG